MADKDFQEDFVDFQEPTSTNIAVEEYIDIFQEFLEAVYKRDVEFLAANYPDQRSIEIDFKKLEAYDLTLAERLIEDPHTMIDAANEALKRIDVGVLEQEADVDFEPRIRFFNLPEESKISIRNVGSECIGKLISVEGMIRQITERLEKMTVAHFVCRRCQNSYDIKQLSQQIKKPVMCECKSREFDIDLEQSKFIDYQKIQVQEPLESLKGSEQASHMEVFLSEDLVNLCSAGDKIIITGIVKLKPPKSADSNIYHKYMVANHLEKVDQEFDELKISPEEVEEIKQLSKKDNIYELLSGSIAPGIYGHDIVKEAIMLQMFGGVKKKVGKQDLRGNIHVLLVGDPSTGKSQLLRYASEIAPKSIYVAGKSASGAGLTVSAVKDDFGEGGWTLKAGAVVLASGGIAMIDEFDKMEAEDRSSLHEAMAQSTVSVSKAGLYAKFRADTSILAAANPKLNRFDKFKNPIEQIDLPFSLLSRFDLYFIIRDSLNRKLDVEMGSKIMEVHEAAEKLAQTDSSKSISKEELEEIEQKVLPKVDPVLFKKYVAYSRQNVKPILTKETSEKILNYYIELRDIGRSQDSFSATPRQLEGLIRLAEASARIKLKDKIEIDDALRAIRIFKTSLEQTSTDLDTGKIDIDIISSGHSTSERSFLKKVLRLIEELSVDGAPVDISELQKLTEQENIKKDKLVDAIIKLKKSGDIYEPKNGFYKATNFMTQ